MTEIAEGISTMRGRLPAQLGYKTAPGYLEDQLYHQHVFWYQSEAEGMWRLWHHVH
jgi:hypothetical protein